MPIFVDYFEKPFKYLQAFILMHLLMELTIVILTLDWLPTFIVFARFYFVHYWFVLSKVEALSRMYLTTNCQLEIFVRYLAIFIHVKFIKQIFELLISQSQTPMLEVKLKFLRQNLPGLFHIQIHECFSQSFPLELDFIKNCLFKILIN